MKGDTFISEEKIDDRAILRRILNPVGYPYSLIIIDGKEVLNYPTHGEHRMVDHYLRNRGIYVK